MKMIKLYINIQLCILIVVLLMEKGCHCGCSIKVLKESVRSTS